VATVRNKKVNRLTEILTTKGYSPRNKGQLPSLSEKSYKKIGTTRWQFHKWQRNEEQPDIQQARILAGIIGIDVTELYKTASVGARATSSTSARRICSALVRSENRKSAP